jgi:hypothetical protein
MTSKVFVNGVENHNNAFRAISDRSVYCKVVHADDRLMPFALRKMVKLAAQHPNVGIVGSYEQSNDGIKWKGLPEDVTVLSGREACRMHLLHDVYVFGTPTTRPSSRIRNRTLTPVPAMRPCVIAISGLFMKCCLRNAYMRGKCHLAFVSWRPFTPPS